MEYLRPNLIKIGGGTYRHSNVLSNSMGFNGEEEEVFFDSNGSGREEEWTQYEAEEWSLEYLSPDRYKAIMDIPSPFYGILIGKKGIAKQKLESDLDVKVTFPTHKSSTNVIIHGSTKTAVMTACRRTHLKVQDSRSKMDFTHFLSIPLNTQCIKETFIKFCNDVSLSESNLQSNIFQKPELLHLTIGVMALLSEKELKLAIQTLNECVKEIVKPILDNESLTISIGGLQIMNDDPSSTCVVYAKITSNKLQEIADKIVEKFSTMGIITRESDHVKLHMTVMNTKFIFSNDVRNKKRISIDASRILANFDGTDFGKVTLKEIHLSEMGHSKKLLKDYYLPSHIVHF